MKDTNIRYQKLVEYDADHGFIYGLYDKREPERLRYVGQTMYLLDRFHRHVSDAFKEKSRSYNLPSARWIRKIGKANLSMKPIYYVPLAEIDEAEIDFIAQLKPDLNLSPGGKGGLRGVPRTEETRKKISASKLGKPQPWMAGENHPNYGKGRIQGDELILVHKLRSEGMSVTGIAAQLKVSRGAIDTALKRGTGS
jgi:hypothetical protein